MLKYGCSLFEWLWDMFNDCIKCVEENVLIKWNDDILHKCSVED